MTKETFIERMIELYKKGGDTRHLRMCAGFECSECPAHKEDDNCYSDELLIDEIIRLREEVKSMKKFLSMITIKLDVVEDE